MTFPGHGNHKVKEFLWRSRGGIADGVDNREFQLVSWGEDNHLRLQHVDPKVLEAVGYVKGSEARKKLNLTRKGAVYKTFRTVENNSSEKKNATITGPRPGSSSLKVSALTIGMKKMSVPHSNRSDAIVRTSAMKDKDKSSKADDQNQKQIGWMSGIKFTRQENESTPQKRPTSRRLSLLNPEFQEDGDWDDPESLHDEIIRIHEQLPKITFDDVNMDKSTVVVSMNGPWGEDGNPIYIKVTISFPDQYPETKAPVFSLGKTSLMSDDIHDKLNKEIKQIAAGFVSRKQGCLEAALCYLLGEVDLESSTLFFDEIDDNDDDLDGLADESSSDDDDMDIPAGASAMMSQELDSSATEDTLGAMSRNANVPLPRLCGARFSANGQLACFFPPKEDKVKSLLETLVVKNHARSKGEPVFETFGRLNNNNSPVSRSKTMSLASEFRTESDPSDDSDISESSDSDSEQFRVTRFPVSGYFRRSTRRPYVRASPTLQSQKSSAAGTGTNTGTGGTGLSRSRSLKPKNIISLHNIGEILPSKVCLADEYAIFGDGPDVCKQNAEVAEKYGFMDLRDIWKYASLVLNNEVPLQVLHQTHRREPILVIAKDAVKHFQEDGGSDSGIDVSNDLSRRNILSGRVKWGTSPLARELISDLLAHFEEVADVQMLAMLSCIFSETVAEDTTSHAEITLTQPQTPLTLKTPAFSVDYFPTVLAVWSMYQRTPINSVVSTPKTAQTPVGFYGSIGSSNGVWGSDPASASYSCGETPPLRSNHASSEHLNQQMQSLSTSPENPRGVRRVNSGLASSFAASFSRPFSMSSSSPPNLLSGRKRPSPVENVLSSFAPSVITWGNTTVLGSVKEELPATKPGSFDDENASYEGKPSYCSGINITIANQNVFDDEGCMSSSLLDPAHASLYASYRRVYAELLYAWGHPLARLEILKFNGLKDYFTEADHLENKSYAGSNLSNDTSHANHDASPTSTVLIGKRHSTGPPSPQGLDVTGYCLKHESRLEPLLSSTAGGAVGRCERCKFVQRQLRCTVCVEPISAVFTACLSCGCVAHQHCLEQYHLSGSTTCPGGCDCDCGKKASDGIVESWEVMMNAMEKKRLMKKERLEDSDDGEKGEWESVNFSSKGFGRGYSTLSKRLGQVRTGEWGMGGVKKKSGSLRGVRA
jgi:hypothetical protein